MALTPTRQKVVDPGQVQTPRANASQFGGQEAQALQGLGGSVQSVATDVQDMGMRRDAYVAKNAYLGARQQSVSFVDQQLQLEGQNAFNAVFDTETQMKDIRDKAMAGMNQRQKNLFLQNWDPAAIQDRERVAVHQQQQIKFAEQKTNESLADTAASDFVRDGSDLSMAAMKAALTTLGKSHGWTPEQFDQNWTKARDYALASRVSALIGAEDFEGTQAFLDKHGQTMGQAETERFNIQLEQAKLARQRRIDAQAADSLRKGQVDEQSFILSTDPAAVPGLEKYFGWYGPELGRIKHAERMAAVQKNPTPTLSEQVDQMQTEQVDQMQTLQEVSATVQDIYAGKTDLNAVYPVIDKLAAMGTESSKLAMSQLKSAISDTRNQAPKALESEQARIFAASVRDFNHVNDKASVLNLYGGEVGTTPTGTINTSNDATDAFLSFWAGWEQYKADALAQEGGTLTIKRLRELETEYFAPLRQAKNKEAFRKAVETVPVFKATDGRGSIYDDDDIQQRKAAAAQQLLDEILGNSKPKG